MKISTRFAFAWMAFWFVWDHLKGFPEPKVGDPFDIKIQGTVK